MSELVLQREQVSNLADVLAVVVAISLPWSTSATSVVLVLWVLVLVPTLDLRLLQQTMRTPAGGLPVLLFLLGVVALGWADVSWGERLNGIDSFPKFLAVPLLLAQFRRSPNGSWVLAGFLASASVQLIASWFFVLGQYPPLPNKVTGVLVKDRIAKGMIFTVCMFGLLEVAAEYWKRAHHFNAALSGGLAIAFFLNVVLVTVSRTALVTVPILLLVFGVRHFRLRHMALFIAGIAAVAAAVWLSSPDLRDRVIQMPYEIEAAHTPAQNTSAGARVEFWTRSIEIMSEAPLIGHGTGSINAEFARVAEGRSNASNPHNQVLAVGIQLGLVGVLVLVAMWVVHCRMFLGPGLASGLGLVIVLQNIICSAFNSHLFDFTEGWIYVFGVGVSGGIVLRGLQHPLTKPN